MRRTWTGADVRLLKALHREERSPHFMVLALQRPLGGVTKKLDDLGLRPIRPALFDPVFTTDAIDALACALALSMDRPRHPDGSYSTGATYRERFHLQADAMARALVRLGYDIVEARP